MTDAELSDALEQLVDRASLARVIDALGTVALVKAAFIEENWADRGLARDWESAARKLEALAPKVVV